MRYLRVAPLIVALLLTVDPAAAGDPQDIAGRVSRQVMSPFCDGLTVHDCPSQQSVELRAEILEMARRGMSAGAIVDELVERYGERIRGVPEPRGTDLLVWIIPGLAAAIAIAAAIALTRRFSARRSGQTGPPHGSAEGGIGIPLSEEERARLNAELGAFRGQM